MAFWIVYLFALIRLWGRVISFHKPAAGDKMGENTLNLFKDENFVKRE